jgi:chromosome segregation ATPase
MLEASRIENADLTGKLREAEDLERSQGAQIVELEEVIAGLEFELSTVKEIHEALVSDHLKVQYDHAKTKEALSSHDGEISRLNEELEIQKCFSIDEYSFPKGNLELSSPRSSSSPSSSSKAFVPPFQYSAFEYKKTTDIYEFISSIKAYAISLYELLIAANSQLSLKSVVLSNLEIKFQESQTYASSLASEIEELEEVIKFLESELATLKLEFENSHKENFNLSSFNSSAQDLLDTYANQIETLEDQLQKALLENNNLSMDYALLREAIIEYEEKINIKV